MKKYIFYEVAKYVSGNYSHLEKERWKKKLKLIAIFSVVVIFIFSGIAIWGTASLIRNFAGSVNPTTLKEIVTKGQNELRAISHQPITTKNCLDAVGSMFSPIKLLTVPLSQNFESVKSACLEEQISPQNNLNKS